MSDFLSEFQPWVVKQLLDLKSKSEEYKTSAAFGATVTVLENIMLFISEYKKTGELKNMQKVSFGELIDLDDIPRKEAADSVKKTIREQAAKIPKGKAQIVKLDKWGTFSNAVTMLKKSGELDKNYKAVKRGDQFLLVHE